MEGNTHFYLSLDGVEDIFDFDMTKEDLLGIIRIEAGDTITIYYEDTGSTLKTVTAFEP